MPRDKHEEEDEKPKFRVIDRRQEAEEAEKVERAEKPEKAGKESSSKRETPVTKAASAEKKAAPEVPSTQDADTGEDDVEITEEEKEEIKREAEASLKFTNTVVFMLRTLAEQTWIHLGLIPNPITGLTIKNLQEAKKSIDLYDNIAKFTANEFEPGLKREIDRLLTDLKLNYTNQAGM